MTFLLGVGDRHLDNLLVCPDGHFFHGESYLIFLNALKASKKLISDIFWGVIRSHFLLYLKSAKKWLMVWVDQHQHITINSKVFALRHTLL